MPADHNASQADFVGVPSSLWPAHVDEAGELPTRWGGRAVTLVWVIGPVSEAGTCEPRLEAMLVQQRAAAEKTLRSSKEALTAAQRTFIKELAAQLGRDWAKTISALEGQESP